MIRFLLAGLSVSGLLGYSLQSLAAPVKNPIAGGEYYVSSDFVNVRNSNDVKAKNVIGKAFANDLVQVLQAPEPGSVLVAVKFRSTQSIDVGSRTLFISKDFLDTNPVDLPSTRFFIVQNLATEKTRVYKRCFTSPNCPHTMVFETEMVIGRPEEGTDQDPHAYKTWVGHSKISEWVKFYSDVKGFYPPWYSDGQGIGSIPPPLTKGISRTLAANQWRVKSSGSKEDSIYGAFGWYAGKLYPEADVSYQWLHGTIGWGKDGAAAIDITRGILVNIFTNTGSHGCTRLENRAIAFLRSFIVPGTDVYRIYAREGSKEIEEESGIFVKKKKPFPRYASVYKNPYQWSYLLLTNGAQKSGGLTADRASIEQTQISVTDENIIEEGLFLAERYPTVMPLDYRYQPSTGKSGDRYAIFSGKDEESELLPFKGIFVVDEGRLFNYQHPKAQYEKGRIIVGGLDPFKTRVPEHLSYYGPVNVPKPQFYVDRNNNLSL